jgi:tRNA(Leu) C34 or U34 (ribose-2'-O)-methylase TrmL
VTVGILLINPKYKHNVGAVVRAASCYDAHSVWFTGDRVSLIGGRREARLPREERMRKYAEVDLRHMGPRPFDRIPDGVTPIAVELSPSAEQLPQFEHPENAWYVFGPEDGGLTRVQTSLCHRHVLIPTRHCVNLAAAVYTVLYDRLAKRQRGGLDQILPSYEVLDEDRLAEVLGLE